MSHRFLPAAAAVLAVAAPLALADGAAAASRRAAAPAELLLTFRERPGLHAFVKAVSDPRSTRYRQYSTVEQLARRYGARPQARRAVAAWASANDLALTISPSGTFAVVGGSASAVADAVGRAGLAAASARDERLPVPAALRGAVGEAALLDDAELPLSTGPTTAGRPRAGAAQAPPQTPAQVETADQVLARLFGSAAERSGTPAGCRPAVEAGEELVYRSAAGDVPLLLQGFTPNQYTTAYGHAEMHRRGFRGEGMRVAVLETDGFKLSDIKTFASCFGLTVPKLSRRLAGVSRFPAPGDETTLDLEFLMAAAPKLDAIDLTFTGSTTTALLRGAVGTLGTPGTRPDVISISLGICEPALAGDLLTVKAISDVYAVAAGAGISTFVATGDSAVTGCERFFGPSMVPAVSAPSVSPFVTAVGGTNITLDSANRLVSERVWNNAPAAISGGGGGISVMFESPWWQGGPEGGAGGRAVPDIAALADPYAGYAFYCTADVADCKGSGPTGGWQAIGGTSAATPLMAAGVALAAQEAKRLGQPPLGLINPLVYALGGGRSASSRRALSDVTLGSNDSGTAVPAAAGGGRALGEFDAQKGYDLASGWGSLKIAGFSAEAVKVAKRQAAKADGDDRRVAAKKTKG